MAGENIEFTYKNKTLTGVVITERDGEITIKLDSGYNIVVPKKELKILKKKELKHAPKTEKAKQKTKKGLPKITILHTGGTVASKVDYETGAVIAKFSPEELLDLFPELGDIANVESRLVSNMMSENMRFAHWNLLAKAVETEVKAGADGVIITHGTDILHMSAAALSFALENINIPVLMVGSQRSSDRPSSDAASNVICAAKFIAETHKIFAGVAVCMHEDIKREDCVILSATKCRKMHTSRRDAFQAINDTPYATISYPQLVVKKLRDYPAKPVGKKFVLKTFNEKLRVGLAMAHPQMFAQELKAYEGFDGLILCLTGLGHAPTIKTDKYSDDNLGVAETLHKLAKKMPVAGAPLTIFGRLDMQVYSPGRALIEMGILGQGLDMTPETAFIKLAWLLSNYKKREDVEKFYGQNLRGEINARIEKDAFLRH